MIGFHIFIISLRNILLQQKKHNFSSKLCSRGANQIWTGDEGVADLCLTTWLRRHNMTPTGFEPMLPPWKGGVLTTWPWSLILMTASRSMQYLKYYETPRAGLEPATARLTAVCSTNWAIEDYYKVYSYYIIYLQNNIQESFYISYTSAFFG